MKKSYGLGNDVRFDIYTRRKKYQLNNNDSDQFQMIPAAIIMFIYRWIQEQLRFGVLHQKKKKKNH